MGTISFVGNHAKFFGGAISVNDPIDVHIIGARFESNTGTSGGAVFVSSVEPTTGGFERCRFDGNSASNGGGLFLSTNDAGVPEKPRFVLDSVFLHNTAGESCSIFLTLFMDWCGLIQFLRCCRFTVSR